MSAADNSSVPSGATKRSGKGGAPLYVRSVVQPRTAKVATATASRIHFRTLLTGSRIGRSTIATSVVILVPSPLSLASRHRAENRDQGKPEQDPMRSMQP